MRKVTKVIIAGGIVSAGLVAGAAIKVAKAFHKESKRKMREVASVTSDLSEAELHLSVCDEWTCPIDLPEDYRGVIHKMCELLGATCCDVEVLDVSDDDGDIHIRCKDDDFLYTGFFYRDMNTISCHKYEIEE